MNVYHNGNMWGNDKHKTPLTPLSINRTFLWEGQELFIPAVYVGGSGAVLDVCAKIPVEEMNFFLKKWNKARRLSLKTPEDYERMDAENPGSKNFAVEMRFDAASLVRSMSSSLNWYPEDIFRAGYEISEEAEELSEEEWQNDKAADKLMAAYKCDPKYCWHFGRYSYNWDGEPLLSPHNVSLTFQAPFTPVSAGYFTTEISCHETQGRISLSAVRCLQDDKYIGPLPIELKTVHPATGQEYTLTLHGCEQTQHSFDDIGAKGVVYPEYCQVLSYSISPEISRNIFDIRDCAEGDRPVRSDSGSRSKRLTGAISVFMAGKNSIPDNRMAASSLHFDPQRSVRWRTIFQIQEKADLEISFPL